MNAAANTGQRRRTWMLMCLAALLCLRLFFAHHMLLTREGADTRPGGDERYYIQIASSLLDQHGFKEGNLQAYRPPLYPAFVALVMAPAGRSLWLLQIVQNCICLCAILLTARLTYHLFGWSAGCVCAAILLVDPMWLVIPQYAASETLFVFLLACALFLAFRLSRRPTAAFALALGVLIGLSALTREIGLYLGIGLLACLLLKRLAPAKLLLVSFLAIFAVILPWTARNYMRLGTFVLITTNSALNLYMGNNPEATGTMRWTLPPGTQALWNKPGTETVIYKAAGSQAIRYILSHPLRTLSLWPAKFWTLWGPMTVAPFQFNLDTGFRVARFLLWIPLVLLAIYGTVLNLRSWICIVIATWACIGTLIHVMTYAQPVYRLPYEFFFAISATLAIVKISDDLRARSRRTKLSGSTV